MRDPYDVLGVKRGASFEEIKAAYRKACKAKHPDMGGSQDEFIELQSAYERILSELKGGRKQERAEAHQKYEHAHARSEQASAGGGNKAGEKPAGDKADGAEDMWTSEAFWRDLEDEMEDLRRSQEFYREAFRERRAKAWERGDRIGWATLGVKDILRFLQGLWRGGAQGVFILMAALAGVGAIIAQFNLISALIILGSGFGLFMATAMKSDKGGVMSAFLLLFGLLTIWSPGVRAAVLGQPFATLSALICLGLIFKFVEQRSFVGIATGGTLALYVLSLIGEDVSKPGPAGGLPIPPVPAPPFPTPQPILPIPPEANLAPGPANGTPPNPRFIVLPKPQPRPGQPSQHDAPGVPPKPEPRTLLAANGSILKFVAGIPYRVSVRSGMTTTLVSTSGAIAFADTPAECVARLILPPAASATPYRPLEKFIHSCAGDAIFSVESVR